jgi:nucleoside-diphosphate-sugar epimerase
MLILGLGYTGHWLAKRLRDDGWKISATRREADGTAIRFDDVTAVHHAIATATHILSSVPPSASDGTDPVLDAYGEAIIASPARWIGYLSSTGVYGDTGGAWVDESAPIGGGRRSARAHADAQWSALREDVRIFRLPGIYGPGRSAIERVREGVAQRINVPGQIFSRVHVDDIIGGILASFHRRPGIYNLADDLPAPQNIVTEAACALTGLPVPALQGLEKAALSPQARGFYAENRRVANSKAKRLLGWKPLYPTYREGLAACLARIATTMPTSERAAPAPATNDQR